MPQDNPFTSLAAQLRFAEELATTYRNGMPQLVATGKMPEHRAKATIDCVAAICETIRIFQSLTETGGPKSKPRVKRSARRGNLYPLELHFASEADRSDFVAWVEAAGSTVKP